MEEEPVEELEGEENVGQEEMEGDDGEKAINHKNRMNRSKPKGTTSENKKASNGKGMSAESADLFKLPDFDSDDDDD